jgi:O-antigen/teichoic acid export membrane protein
MALEATFLRVVGGLALVGLPPFAVVFLFGEPLFALAFGAEWARAGEYASWLAVWLYFMLVNRPCVGATSVLNMQRTFLVQTVFTLVARAASLLIGVWYFSNDLLAIALFSLVGGISCVSLIVLVLVRIRNEQRAAKMTTRPHRNETP